MLRRTILILLLILLAQPLPGSAEEETEGVPSEAELKRKTVLLNAAVAGGILTWGVVNWGYFQTAPKATSEGWFEHDTNEGGGRQARPRLHHLRHQPGLQPRLPQLGVLSGAG